MSVDLSVLENLKASERVVLDKAAGEETIRALRRGVGRVAVAEALGLTPGNLYQALGSWALRHAFIPEKSK